MNVIFGATYRDKITGFKGIATGHCRYMTGCHQVLLQPPAKSLGEFQEARWFDEQRCEPVKAKVISIDNGATPGFDVPAPIR